MHSVRAAVGRSEMTVRQEAVLRVLHVRREGAVLVRCCILENSSRRLLHNAYEHEIQIDAKENGPSEKRRREKREEFDWF